MATLPYVTKAVTGNPYKTSGATVVNGGAVSRVQNMTPNVIVVKDQLAAVTRYGKQNSTTTSYKAKAVNAGLMGGMQAGYYVIQTYCPRLAGQASTLLLNPGASASLVRRFNSLTSITTTRVVTAGWNLKGQLLSVPTTATDSFGTDNAATAGRKPYRAGYLTFTATGLANTGVLSSQIKRTFYEDKTL